MKALITLVLTAIFAGQTSLLAQLSPDQAPIEAASPKPTASAPAASSPVPAPAHDSKSDLAKKWRAEVLGWKDPQRVQEGATSQSINAVKRSVLILGTVNGNVSTVSGDIAVLGDVNGDVSAIAGTITVLGNVNGKASTVSGDLRVAGKVTGSTSVVGGKIETAPGGQLLSSSNSTFDGQFNFHPATFNGDFHFNGGGPGSIIHDFWLSPFMLLLRSGMLIVWVALSSAMAALFQPAILRAQADLRKSPARSAALGFLWMILFWVLLAMSLFLSLMLIGIPLVILLVAFDIGLSVFGMTLVFSVTGDWLARRLNHPNVSIYAAVFVGACFLGLLRVVPIVGTIVWFAAGLFGVGCTLATRFGAPPAPAASAPTAALPIAA